MISKLMQRPTSFLEPTGQNMKNMTNESLVFSNRSFAVQKCCVYAVKTHCCYDSNSNNYKVTSKSSNKRTLEDCGDGPMPKYQKVLDLFINVTSTSRGFRTVHHSEATYEQAKKGLSYFLPKRKCRRWWYSHTPFEFVNHFIMHCNFFLKN